MNVNLITAAVHAEHGVDEDQFEPVLTDAEQARLHELSIRMADMNVGVSLGLSYKADIEFRAPVRVVDLNPSFFGEDGGQLTDYSSIHHRDETLFGLGDVSVMGRYRLIEPVVGKRLTLDLRVGLSLPTGSTGPDPFALGREGESHQHVTFGTGTVDPLLGLESSVRLDKSTWFGWTQVSTSPQENQFGYRAPTKAMGGLTVASSFGSTTWQLRAGTEIYHETPATWSGEQANNSGRTDVIGTMGLSYSASETWNIHGSVKAPWTIRAMGGQMSTPLIFVVGVGRNTLLSRTD